MKYILLSLLISFPALADQGNLLGMARDQQLLQLTKVLGEYCENNYPDMMKEKDALFLCYVQLHADCKNAESKLKDFACEIRGNARYLEKNTIAAHAGVSQVKKDFIGSQLERLRDPCKFDKTLAECNITGQLAADRAPASVAPQLCKNGSKVRAFFAGADTSKIEQVCEDGTTEILRP